MGHYCRICGQNRPNEQFSGSGHKTHICKKCAKLPHDEIQNIEVEQEICCYLNQSVISLKNLKRLKTLTNSSNVKIANIATLVLEIGQLYPRKKKRYVQLARGHKDILNRLAEIGVFENVFAYSVD